MATQINGNSKKAAAGESLWNRRGLLKAGAILGSQLLNCNFGGMLSATEKLADTQRRSAVNRGVEWLLAKQAEDGLWHSETYGLLKSGYGISSLILLTLSRMHGGLRQQTGDAYRRGVRRLLKAIDSDGMLTRDGEGVDEPVYAAAHLLAALHFRPVDATAAVTRQLTRALWRTQRTTVNGWPQDFPGFGAWGTSMEPSFQVDLSVPSTLSVTTAVLTALSVQQALKAESKGAAMQFLARCQAGGDYPLPLHGGFWFTPEATHLLNKAGWFADGNEISRARPYLAATCDGILSLAACGLTRHDERMKSAIAYLIRHSSHFLPDTSNHAHAQEREQANSVERQGLFYYRSAALHRLCQQVEMPSAIASIQSSIEETLLRVQERNGCWKNSNAAMREDDPLIATAYSLQILG